MWLDQWVAELRNLLNMTLLPRWLCVNSSGTKWRLKIAKLVFFSVYNDIAIQQFRQIQQTQAIQWNQMAQNLYTRNFALDLLEIFSSCLIEVRGRIYFFFAKISTKRLGCLSLFQISNEDFECVLIYCQPWMLYFMRFNVLDLYYLDWAL